MKIYFYLIIYLLILSCDKCPIPFSYELAAQFTVNQGSEIIAIDNDKGYIYIADPFDTTQVHQYSLQGNQVRILVDFTQDYIGDYEFYNVVDLVVDDISNIYILVIPWFQNPDGDKSFLNGFCIIKYNSDGEFQKEFDFTNISESWYRSVLAYKNNILYVTNGHRLIKINSEDGLYTYFNLQSQNNTEPYIHTTDMAIDDDNNIWLVGQAQWFSDNDFQVGVQVIRFDSNCQNQETFNANCRASFFGAGMNNPGITFDSYNNMYLATFYCKSIEIYDFDQEFQREIKMENENSLPIDIVIDNNNNLYVLVHNSGNNTIMIYELDS